MKKFGKKASIIATSVATIAVCSSLVVGSTFALFTSEDSVNIAVTSGSVAVEASISGAKVLRPTTVNEDGTTSDDHAATTEATATVNDDGNLVVTNVIPGDKVTFDINVKNNGTVSAKYNYELGATKGFALMSKFAVTIDGNDGLQGETNLKKYTSAWSESFAAGASATYSVTMELPGSVGGGEYEGVTTELDVLVHAVQANANVSGEASVENFTTTNEVADALALETALQDGGEYILSDDIDADYTNEGTVYSDLWIKSDTTLDLNGHTVKGNGSFLFVVDSSFTATIKNGNIEATSASGIGVYSFDGSNTTLENVNIKGAFGVYSVGGDLTMKGSEIEAQYGIRAMAAKSAYTGTPAEAGVTVNKVTIEDCEIVIPDNGQNKTQYGMELRTVNATIKNTDITVNSAYAASACTTVFRDSTVVFEKCNLKNANGYGVSGQGTLDQTSLACGINNDVTFNNCKVDALIGIFQPQKNGTLAVNGGSITGSQVAVEVRSGIATFNNTTLICEADTFSITPSGSGTTVIGAALAVSQHTTNCDINVTVNGSTLKGYYALYEEDVQDELATDKITITLGEGNTLTGGVYSENCSNIAAIDPNPGA